VAAFTCPVTHPNRSAPPGGTANDSTHGKRGLWTVLPPDGVLRITTRIPGPGETFGSLYSDGSLSTKFPWFRSRRAGADLVINGRRLDAASPKLHRAFRDGPGGSQAQSPHFWPTRLRFAAPGCWRVTAKSGHTARLTFTLAVERAAT